MKLFFLMLCITSITITKGQTVQWPSHYSDEYKDSLRKIASDMAYFETAKLKDSSKKTYDKKYKECLKNIIEYDIAKRENTIAKNHLKLLTEQRDMLMGALKTIDKIRSQKGAISAAQSRMAKGALEDINETKWLPELKGLVESAKRIYGYLASLEPTL